MILNTKFIQFTEIMDAKEIEEIVQRLKISRRWKELSLNLSFICKGIKPGLLWDLGKINVKMLLELRVILQDIFVLDFSGDYFVSSRKCFNKHFQNLESNFPFVIDISNNLTEPRIATTETENKIRKDFRTLVSHINGSDEDVIEIDVGDYSNVTTMFGLLLGYPVVYYYDTGIEGNCLSNRDLTVYKIGSQNLWPISFSVPTNLLPQTSIPDWLDKLRTSFSDLDIKSESVNLPFVAM